MALLSAAAPPACPTAASMRVRDGSWPGKPSYLPGNRELSGGPKGHRPTTLWLEVAAWGSRRGGCPETGTDIGRVSHFPASNSVPSALTMMDAIFYHAGGNWSLALAQREGMEAVGHA